MALEIKKEGLFNWNGGQPLPIEGILVRPETNLKQDKTIFKVRYVLNPKYADVIIAWEQEVPIYEYDEEGNQTDTGQTKIQLMRLPNEFTEVISMERMTDVMQKSQIAAQQAATAMGQPQMMPFLMNVFQFHIPVKEWIEKSLGEGSVILRPDLIVIN